jgi:short-subunit dehydrogenase
MRLNYLGTVFVVKAAAEAMVARGSGTIVAISSGAAAASFLGYSSYAPTKFAVRGFMDAIRNELLGTGVRCSIAYPPDTDTPGFEKENTTKPPECQRISPPEVHSASTVAQLILSGAADGVYHLPSPDLVQNQLIYSTAGITPTPGSSAVLMALSPLLTVAGRLFGCWADHVARGYGASLRKNM